MACSHHDKQAVEEICGRLAVSAMHGCFQLGEHDALAAMQVGV